MFGGWAYSTPIVASGEETLVQRTSGGVSVVDQRNASERLISPAGITRGLSLRASDTDDDLFTGRVSLGLLSIGLIGLMLMYLWTRNVQGGG